MIKKSILIVGAGPVGSLLAIYMAKRGYEVSVYEKRTDPRKTMVDDGRSINLALSHRGIHALKKAGVEKLLLESAIPMKGRMIHNLNGGQSFQPYGEKGQYINSVSRGGLNRTLIEIAASEFGVRFYFDKKCTEIDFENNILTVEGNSKENIPYELLAATDGAFSIIRNKLNLVCGKEAETNKLSHGYKELTIPPSKSGNHLIEKNALHIWPRGSFMLIALPNTDGSFTCTLFLPFEGENSFAEVNSKEALMGLFKNYFPDALPLIKGVEEEYFALEPSFLSTVKTYPWIHNNVFLIGDAAHAMVPFYGQGMNAGFEDIRILDELLEEYKENWDEVLPIFQTQRKPNADAITVLAMQNFIEMRDLVDDDDFILRKKIEFRLHEKYPTYLPLYSMVTFSDMPYSEALQKGKEHDDLMKAILSIPEIPLIWNTPIGWTKIEKMFAESIQ